MSTPDLSSVLAVFRLLARQRSAVTHAGSEFGAVVSRLAGSGEHALLKLTPDDQTSGYLLLQHGRLVFAQHGVLTGQAAADHLEIAAPMSTLRLFVLESAAAALAFAAVGGTPSGAADQVHGSLGAHLDGFHLDSLVEAQFSGVVAVRQEGRVQVRQLQGGRLLAQQELPGAVTFESYLQLGWTDHDLPRLSLGAQRGQPEREPEPSPRPGARADRPAESAVPAAPPTLVAQDAAADSHVWAQFQQVLDMQLGDAAARLCAVLYAQHGRETGGPLVAALTTQVERVAGHAAGLEFYRRVSLAPNRLEEPL